MAKSSGSLAWNHFSGGESTDNMITRDRIRQTWVRAGRIPEPPRFEHPWLSWSQYASKRKSHPERKHALIFLKEMEQYVTSPQMVAALSQYRGKWFPKQTAPSADLRTYFRELEARGVSGIHVLDLIAGMTPQQSVDLFLIMRQVSCLAFMHGAMQRHRRNLLTIWRQYQVYLPLLQDEALRPETRSMLREDLDTIFRCIRVDTSTKGAARTIPKKGITVVPTGDLSRQAFWTGPAVALVEYLRPILGSFQAAYVATARLFHILFGYPDKPLLIKRRHLHFQRKQSR
jgi:hypothetical protein